MNFLELNQLSKKFSGEGGWAVENTSFHLKDGEILSLIGESGSGKSTLLRLIAGFEDADNGEVFFKGEKVKGPAFNVVPGQAGIEIVNQDFELFEYLTVFDNIAHFIDLMDKEYRKQRVAELLEVCHLENFANKYPSQLSGGEQQRVALARALAKEPSLILLDEPFSNLDVRLKNELKFSLRKILNETATAAIFVTHDTQDALVISERIAIIDKGGITQIGTPQEIYERPKNPYVAALFGDVNIINSSELRDWTLNERFSDDEKTIYCLRPENISFNKSGGLLKVKVIRKEYFGIFWRLEIRIGKRTLLMNSKEKTIKVGDEFYCDFPLRVLHLFDH